MNLILLTPHAGVYQVPEKEAPTPGSVLWGSEYQPTGSSRHHGEWVRGRWKSHPVIGAHPPPSPEDEEMGGAGAVSKGFASQVLTRKQWDPTDSRLSALRAETTSNLFLCSQKSRPQIFVVDVLDHSHILCLQFEQIFMVEY